MLLPVLWIVAIACLITIARVENFAGFLVDVAMGLVYIPYGIRMQAENSKPQYWESSAARGFDETYRKLDKLYDYETQALYEAGWQQTKGADGYTGPNINVMIISTCLVTLFCFSFLALVALM